MFCERVALRHMFHRAEGQMLIFIASRTRLGLCGAPRSVQLHPLTVTGKHVISQKANC